jgi:RNA polymerase sigma-70 factor (ECF subfamily)
VLQIVRNQAYAALRTRGGAALVPLAADDVPEPADPGDDPELALVRARDRAELDRLLGALPVELRETLVLRELEEMSYRDIAQVTQTPIGTVMSRLWRARRLLAVAARRSVTT